MSKLVNMFLVSDVVNFGDIILQEIESVKNSSKKQATFSGNIFELTITRRESVLSNMLDTQMTNETVKTDQLHQLIKSSLINNRIK